MLPQVARRACIYLAAGAGGVSFRRRTPLSGGSGTARPRSSFSRKSRPEAALPCASGRRRVRVRESYFLQPGNLKETTRVRQVPITSTSSARYSCVYQKVQSSLGSTVRSL